MPIRPNQAYEVAGQPLEKAGDGQSDGTRANYQDIQGVRSPSHSYTTPESRRMAGLPTFRICVPGPARRRAIIDDVVQETLLAAHHARQTYDPGRPFAPWFYDCRLIDASSSDM
jgi:hypothetical protein